MQESLSHINLKISEVIFINRSQLESNINILCRWFVVFRYPLNLQNSISSTKYILTPLVYHKKKSRFFTPICSLCLLPHNLLSFGSLGTKINKSKSVAFTMHSNYIFQTQEAVKILKTKQNKTMIIISWVAMQIRTNCGQYKDMK